MKMKPYSLIILLVFSFLSWQCGGNEKKETTEETVEEVKTEPSLTLVWETTADLPTNESVHYEESTGAIYVANIDGGPDAKDGKGSIAIISKTGEIIDANWVSGIDAPKGMAVMDGKLYVTNIDELVEIDTDSGEITNTYEVPGSIFLNDADTDGSRVYFSDMRAGNILYLEDGEITVFAENQENINGLRVGQDNTLYGLDAEGLKKYREDGSFEIINDVVKGGDGLIILDENTFLASRWQGEIYLIQDGRETLLLDTKAEESNTADIGFIPEENLVLVPTFFKNKVAAYKLVY